MTRIKFIDLLQKASAASVDFARSYVRNRLSEVLRYHIVLNQSFDGNATPEEQLYPEDDEKEYTVSSMDEVADVLLREGRCPAWIDVSVEAEGADFTLLRLLCCGRYTDNCSRMYYDFQGTGPFGIKSPDLPPGHRDGERFDIPTIGVS